MKPIKSRGATKELLKALEGVAKNDPNEYMVDDLGRAVVNMLPAAEVETQGYEPRDLSLDVLKAMGVVGREGLGMLPVVGELLDAAEVNNARMYGTDFYGDEISPQLLGGLTAAGYLVPNIVERPLKAIARPIRRMLRNKDFVSEIDWGKWNPDTPNHPELMDEYADIEWRTKKDGTWMKNADGTDFQGSPEQFVQQQSSYYKAAYPTGTQTAYRGVKSHNGTSPLINFSQSRLRPNIFASLDKEQAQAYSYGWDNIMTPQKLHDQGVFELLYPNPHSSNPRMEIDATGSHWSNLIPSESLEESLSRIRPRIADPNYYMDLAVKSGSGPFTQDKAVSMKDNLRKMWETYDPEAAKAFLDEARQKLEHKMNYTSEISTDALDAILSEMDVNSVLLRNLDDENVGDVIINKNEPGNFLKSAVGNVGFFDLNDPDVFKAIVPILGLSTAVALREKQRES